MAFCPDRRPTRKAYRIILKAERALISILEKNDRNMSSTEDQRLQEIHGSSDCHICGHLRWKEGGPFCSYPHGRLPENPQEEPAIEAQDGWYRVNDPDQFTCGVKVRDRKIVGAGPTLAHWVGRTLTDLVVFCQEKSWTLEGPLPL